MPSVLALRHILVRKRRISRRLWQSTKRRSRSVQPVTLTVQLVSTILGSHFTPVILLIQTCWKRSHSREAVRLYSPGDPERACSLNSLGNALCARCKREANFEALGEAIELYREAVRLTPSKFPSRGDWMTNLGNVLIDRYERTGNAPDIKEAIVFYREASQFYPPGDTNHANSISNLGNAVYTCYQQNYDSADLEEAIALLRKAIRLSSLPCPGRERSLKNLSSALEMWSARPGPSRPEGLKEIIQGYEEVL